MGISFGSRLQHAWNAFLNRDPTGGYYNSGPGYSVRPDRIRLTRGNERSIITSIYNRVAIDASSIDICHCRLDNDNRFLGVISSGLNECLNTEANKDQTGRAFLQDVVMSLLDEGCVAIVPVDTTFDPAESSSYEIHTMRVGKIIQWYPDDIGVRLYNDRTGMKEDIRLPKKTVAIIENPFYSIMNEPNSTLQRLIRKLNILDAIDEQSSSGKLDLIIQLPYSVRSPALKQRAETRRKDLEYQLSHSKFGVAYADGTERIVQLNRSVDNNLMKQIEYLTSMLFSQLGITQSILDGTADEATMLNYMNRMIEPILSAIVDEMKRKFLTKTARTQLQSILFFRDPFKLVPVNSIAEIADKFTRNEIMTSNEIRQGIGMKPSKDKKADELRNSNITKPESNVNGMVDDDGGSVKEEKTEEKIQNGL
ncbi:MAG: phage portal protein [Eubacteriales bacterium]|nr:phage portal protein [Eubacteriales bacterium]